MPPTVDDELKKEIENFEKIEKEAKTYMIRLKIESKGNDALLSKLDEKFKVINRIIAGRSFGKDTVERIKRETKELKSALDELKKMVPILKRIKMKARSCSMYWERNVLKILKDYSYKYKIDLGEHNGIHHYLLVPNKEFFDTLNAKTKSDATLTTTSLDDALEYIFEANSTLTKVEKTEFRLKTFKPDKYLKLFDKTYSEKVNLSNIFKEIDKNITDITSV